MTRYALILSFLMASVAAASAQAPPVPATPPAPTVPAAPSIDGCAPTHPVLPRGTISPDGSTTGQAAEPLGDKLAKSNGVLCPPAGVDPEMHAPPPPTGDSAVIPPPGSSGGNPNLRPK